MGELKFKGVVEASEMLVLDSQYKQLVDDIMKNLKDNKGKAVEITETANSKDEVKKDVNKLRTQIRRSFGKDSEYGQIGFVIKDAGNNQFRVFACMSDKAKKKGAGKAKKSAPKAQKAGAQPGQGQAKSMEEMKNEMLQTINNMPPEALSMVMAQYQTIAAAKQQELAVPDIKEADSARLKEEIQMMQEVIEAVKKKMGN